MNTCKRPRPTHRPASDSSQPTVTLFKETDFITVLGITAEKRVKAKLGFYIHATIFVLVSAMQFGTNLFTTPWVLWSIFPFIGWGLGVAIHGLVVWFKTSDLLKHSIEEELEKLQNPQVVETPPRRSR